MRRKSRTDVRRGSFCRELRGEFEFEVEKIPSIFAQGGGEEGRRSSKKQNLHQGVRKKAIWPIKTRMSRNIKYPDTIKPNMD